MSQEPQRILVVAPHPDDEALGAGGIMAKAHDLGHEVSVVLLTCGDGFVQDAARYYLSLEVTADEYLHMGYERQMETQRALAEVGVSKERIYFLGFPDGGLDSLWVTHWSGEPWRSTTTAKNTVPYVTAYRPEVPYLGAELVSLLMGIYAAVRPTQLILPSAFDTHPDHWATNAFGTLAWAEMAYRDPAFRLVPRWGYLVHWPAWPLPLAYRPTMPQEAPERLVNLGQEPWHAESLSPEQVEQKRLALMQYESQVELIKPYMLAFSRRTEMFGVESEWRGQKGTGALEVTNPSVDWLSRSVGKSNPIETVTWGRHGDRDWARLTVARRWGSDWSLEVSLHPVDGRHGQYHWLVQGQHPIPAEISVRAEGRNVEMNWPAEWIGTTAWVMAGLQVRVRGRVEGKIPFRMIPWGDLM